MTNVFEHLHDIYKTVYTVYILKIKVFLATLYYYSVYFFILN